MFNIKNKKEESFKGKLSSDDFLKNILTTENNIKIETFFKKKNLNIWNNFFKEDFFFKPEFKDKIETLSNKSENLSQNEGNESFSIEDQIVKKTASYENLKNSFDHLIFMKNEDYLYNSDIKIKAFTFNNNDSETKELTDRNFIILNSLNEKNEFLIQNYFRYLKLKAKYKKINYCSFKNFLQAQCITEIYGFSKFLNKDISNRLNFKYCLKSTCSMFYQRKKIEFAIYEENCRKNQNFKLKKSKEIRKKETIQLIKNKILKNSCNLESLSKIEDQMKNSIENSSNNNDSFLYTDEDEQNSIGLTLEIEKKNTNFDKKEADELILEEIKTKLTPWLKSPEKIEKFFIVSYLKKTEICLSFLIFTEKKIYIFINLNNYKEKQKIEFGEIDKIFIIKKGYVDNLKQVLNDGLDLKNYKTVIIKKVEISEIHTRRYLLQICAIELLKNNKSFFFICGRDNLENLYSTFLKFLSITKIKKNIKTNSLLHLSLINGNFFHYNLTKLLNKRKFQTYDSQDIVKIILPFWEEGKISNFNYLMILNIISGRTYSDLSQYPVFPWILSYNEELVALDFCDEKNYRVLSKPMGAINEDKAKNVKDHYTNIMNTLDSPPFHYGSHYSNPVVILYYLIRLMPYSEWAKDLQG